MVLADIPGGRTSPYHGAIVSLSVPHHQRVLLGAKARLGVIPILRELVAELREHLDHLVLARGGDESRRPSVLSNVLTVRLKALVGAPGGIDRFRIYAFEVLDHRLHRVPQAVDVQPVEAYPLLLQEPVVVPPKPLGELEDLLVSPHPGRPPLEGPQHFAGALSGVRIALNVAVHLVTVRPVPLRGDKGEALLSDQPLADACPPRIVLGGTVRGLPQKDESCIPDSRQERVQVLRLSKRMRPPSHHIL